MMNQDDPEVRIAALERRLEEQNYAARPERSEDLAVTPDDVHNVAFSKSARGRSGYNEDEVDEFLGRVEIELARRTGQRTAQDFSATTDLGPRHLRHSDESTQQGILGHILAFRGELREHGSRPWTWRAPLVIGLLLVGVACLPPFDPLVLVIGVSFWIWAALAWRFGWEF
jgi:DivIVA domain-containing protein